MENLLQNFRKTVLMREEVKVEVEVKTDTEYKKC